MRPNITGSEIQSGSSAGENSLRREYEALCEWLETDPVFIVCNDNFARIFKRYFREDWEEAERVIAEQDAKYSGLLGRIFRPIVEPFERYDIVLKYKCAKEVLKEKI